MRRPLISVFAWLLIVAVPAQGYAAATMVNCGPRHHGSSAHHNHDFGVPHQHDPGLHASYHTHHDATIHDGEVDTSDSAGAKLAAKLGCSACAACCIGIAIPISITSQFSAAPTSKPYSEVVRPPVDVVVYGPDRPPRLFVV